MIFIVCGPTGSGKTLASIKLSEHYNAPIVNADAFQIYREMDIGTAKIDKNSPYYKRHYLLDIKNPDEDFSVMEYQKLFREKIADLQGKYQNIVVCGGTGLYIRASIYDYVFTPEKPQDTSKYDKLSNDELYNLLLKLDPDSAKALHKNNRKRVLRAVLIAENNSLTKSETIKQQEHKIIYNDIKILMLNPNREQLYVNINNRVDQMFEKGLINEVKSLRQKYELSQTAKAAIGYKEVIDYLDGHISLEDCKELIKKRTRNYAKRQVTFFKNQFDLKMYESVDELLKDNLR